MKIKLLPSKKFYANELGRVVITVATGSEIRATLETQSIAVQAWQKKHGDRPVQAARCAREMENEIEYVIRSWVR